MALSTASISYDISDLVGADFDARRTKVWVTTNVDGDTIIDTVGNAIRVGDGLGSVAEDGTGSVAVWVPGTGSNPESWQTTVHLDYAPRRPGAARVQRSFGPFTVSASANLADLIEEQEVPPNYLSAVTTLLQGYVDEAEAARDEAVDLSGIDTSDALVAALAADPDSETSTTLGGTYAQKRIVPASKAQVWGHSYAAGVGVGVTASDDDFITLLCEALNLPVEQHAVGGTTLYNYISADANWTSVARDVERPTTFDALGGFIPVMYGINDVNQLGNTQAALKPFTHALRFVLSRLRSGAVFSDTDPTIVHGGGGWSGAADVPAVGIHLSYNASNSKTVTITTPASTPAGYVVLNVMTWNDGGGAIFTGSNAASGYNLDSHEFSTTDSRNVGVIRVPTDGGAATYTWTTSGVSGAIGATDFGWHWEPVMEAGPLIPLVLQPKPVDYIGYGAVSPGPPTDAGITALNAVQTSLAAEFGARVLLVDTTVMDKSATYFATGNVHPNQAGHAKLAELVLAAVNTAATIMVAPLDRPAVPDAPPPAWTAYTPVVSGTGSAKGNGTTSGAYIERDDDTVEFYAQFILGSTSTVGSAIEPSLPVAALSSLAVGTMSVMAQDAGTGFVPLCPIVLDPGKAIILTYTGASVTSTVPFTWAVNDVIELRGSYRAA